MRHLLPGPAGLPPRRGARLSAQRGIAAALAKLASMESDAWLVGGALRDRLLGRQTTDYDVTIDGHVREAARAVARATNAHTFELSEGFGVWRVVSGAGDDPRWQLDLLPVAQGSIERDLGLRDLTVNALAQRLGTEEIVDPFGGLADLREHRLRMVSADAFARDPVRTLRLARLAVALDFTVEAKTAAESRHQASGLEQVAPERVFEELKQIVAGPGPVRGLQLLDELEITPAVLPELWELRGVEQSRYHHLDAYGHTLAVLAETIELEGSPAEQLGPWWEAADALLRAPLANDLTRWQALRFGALLHDIAKSRTRSVSADGHVTFLAHDVAGAQMASEILVRLRSSERLREHVAALVRNHVRLGFLVHETPLSRRTIYRYLRASAPVGVDVTVLSMADRLATRGARSEEEIARHLELAQRMLGEALQWEAAPPRPPLRGDELARALGIRPGPLLGELLAELEEASFAHEVGSKQEAISHAQELLRHRTSPGSAR